jgi:hypothetical protein
MEKTKILLIGGVGNRLFQIARAVSKQDKNNFTEVITLSHATEKIASIFGWSNHQQWINLKELCQSLGVNYRQATFLESIFIICIYIIRKAEISNYPFNVPLKEIKTNSLDLGYFQTPHHVNKKAVLNIANQLRSQIKINQTEKTVVHIRGGDFTAETRTSNSDIDKVQDNPEEILYVTNDVKYAREILKKKKDVNIQKSISDLSDFIMLSAAKKIYPSNSTFSFWAAAIVKESGGEVIQPNENVMWQLLTD